MKLYHGTSANCLNQILSDGLTPRIVNGKSTWEHTVPSRMDAVYLTEVYAGYFACCACKNSRDNWLILEIDTDLLDQTLLMPDEDFLEQVTRIKEIAVKLGVPGQVAKYKMKTRTRWFRERLELFHGQWVTSLKMLGNCCYLGTIPMSAITRIVSFDPASNKYVSWGCSDPVINFQNYSFMKNKYKELTRWFFEENIDPAKIEEVLSLTAHDSEFSVFLNQRLEHIKNQINIRSGLKKIK